MLTIRQYAEMHGISYEAARQQVNRHKEALEGHIMREGRTQYLDDIAVGILDEARTKQPIIMQETNDRRELEDLRAQNAALLLKITELQDQLLSERAKVVQLQEKMMGMLDGSDEDTNQEATQADQETLIEDEAPAPETIDANETIDAQPVEIDQEDKPRTIWQRLLYVLRG